MPDVFNDMNDALRHAAEGLLRAIELSKVAHDEHTNVLERVDDLRETVTRLEHLVMDQGQEMRGLRADVQALRDQRNQPPPTDL